MTTIAARLTRARQYRNYPNAKDFAAKHGLTYGTYLAHETGDRNPKLDKLKEYAKLLDVNLNWLTYGKGSMTDPNDMDYSQPATDGGVGDAPYTGARYSSGRAAPSVEVSEFLAHYHALSPTAKASIKSLLRDELLLEMDSGEAVNAIKSHPAKAGISDSSKSGAKGRRK